MASMKGFLKILPVVVFGVAALALSVPGTAAQKEQNAEQNTINTGAKNKIQQRIKFCKKLDQNATSLDAQISQSAIQNATAIGEKNHIQQRIKFCCKPDAATVEAQLQQLQVAEQNAMAIGDKNRIRQRIDMCNL
jgi:hypothetical protein